MKLNCMAHLCPWAGRPRQASTLSLSQPQHRPWFSAHSCCPWPPVLDIWTTVCHARPSLHLRMLTLRGGKTAFSPKSSTALHLKAASLRPSPPVALNRRKFDRPLPSAQIFLALPEPRLTLVPRLRPLPADHSWPTQVDPQAALLSYLTQSSLLTIH
jgi:hypothetical protein